MIEFSQCDIEVSETFSLRNIDWRIQPGEQWLITGANGSGKSALGAVLAGAGKTTRGSLNGLPEKISLVSFETQRALIDAEREQDESDITDVVFEGTPVEEILLASCEDERLMRSLVADFQIENLLARGFRTLSTGETRKILMIKALSEKPQLLIVDEPFDGLDSASAERMSAVLKLWSEKLTLVLILNRLDEMCDFTSHLLYLKAGEVLQQLAVQDEQAMCDFKQLLHLRRQDLSIPQPDPGEALPALDPEQPLIRLRKARVAYGDNVIFSDLNWQVDRGVHWQVTGANGSGKTCLLNLVTGDHPQCYVNDIFVFGFQRGSGESIWQIKQYIGYVSTALQWEYRVSISLLNVIISGFYDSIGLYQAATDSQKLIAKQWLELLGMSDRHDQPFNQLSYGDQRLLLIARAMVKHPPVLILDEPCLGLDEINRHWVLALIEKICHGSETTVIYVNHHASDRIDGIDNFLALPGQ